jgi:hypothetical protein
MSDASPSKVGGNGKDSKIWRLFRGKKVKESPPPNTESVERRSKAIDEQIEDLRARDQEIHNNLLEDAKQAIRRFRCANLRIKRMNGGLTQEEEAELAQEC